MTTKTLFGHLAVQFSSHPENLATEAFAYILRNSQAASDEFVRRLKATGVGIPDRLTFATQMAGTDGCIPDMKCVDMDGNARVVVENKFWAGLTENQPTTYLRELAAGLPSVLLFVVPESRQKLVWDELTQRCFGAGVSLTSFCAANQIWTADVDATHKLGVTTWPSLLSALASATLEAHDVSAHNDVIQLRGLCDRMDAEAFLPLSGEELSNLEFPRRFIDFSSLPFDIIAEAEKAGYCDTKGQRETPSRYGSGKYVHIGRFNPWLAFDAAAWRELGSSPMWLHFVPDYNNLTEVRELLSSMRLCNPCLCFDFAGYVSVPLILSTGVEKDAIVRGAVSQVGHVAALLSAAGRAATAT